MSPSTTSIEDLPPEMISELFEYLSPKDLATCSLVNKHWHSIYSNFKLHSLVVTDSHFYNIKKWYDSNQTVRDAERCHPAMFVSLVEKPLLSNLKHLALTDFEFDFNVLSRFQQLVHLEINIPSDGKNVHLNLSSLKVLAFYGWNNHCDLSIDSPQLNTLLYRGENENANRLKVKHPETIRKLETGMVVPRWLALFKNVECLITEEFEAISKATLLSLPKLRELHYNRNIWWAFYMNRRIGTVDRVKQELGEFMDEAKKLRGNDFRFTFAGLQLTHVNVDQIDLGVQVDKSGEETVSEEYVYMKNYHLIELGALPLVDQINYTLLLSHVTGEFPLCFSQKFTDIQKVIATSKVPDTNHFLWFLKSLKSLRSLALKNTGLGQEFYDQLPESVPSLRSLKLREGHCEDGLQLDFDFISRLSRLSELKVSRRLAIASFPRLIVR